MSLWSDVSDEVEDVATAHGISFFSKKKTTTRNKAILNHERLNDNLMHII